MVGKIYEQVEGYIVDAFKDTPREVIHLKRTAHWAQEFFPSADEALLVAAVSHDIERATREKKVPIGELSSESFLNEKHLQHHQEKGAEIMSAYLESIGASSDFIKRVSRLISRHEIGGYKDESILKDADSVSFFENNIDFFVTKVTLLRTRESIREKFDWMYNRIGDPAAKRIAFPFYDTAVFRLTGAHVTSSKIIRAVVVAGVVIEKDGKYLLVQENRPGTPVHGLWNLPAGTVEGEETIEQTALKEGQEETGYKVELGRKIGVFQENAHVAVKHAFEAKIIGGELNWPKDEILEARWFSLDEILSMRDKLREEWVLGVIELAG